MWIFLSKNQISGTSNRRDPNRADAIKSMTKPTNVTALQSLGGGG